MASLTPDSKKIFKKIFFIDSTKLIPVGYVNVNTIFD